MQPSRNFHCKERLFATQASRNELRLGRSDANGTDPPAFPVCLARSEGGRSKSTMGRMSSRSGPARATSDKQPGGTRQRCFEETRSKPREPPDNAQTSTSRVHAVSGSVDIFFYSLRSSSSGVGFWKKAIQGFIASSEIMKLSCEGREFLSSSRLNSSSSGTSR